MIKDCIIVGIETTEGETHLVNEVGAVHYSVDHQCIVGCFSTLIATQKDLFGLLAGKVEPPNTISGINPEAVDQYGTSTRDLRRLIYGGLSLLGYEDIPFISHNASHEQKYISHPNWLCTYVDFDLYPEGYVGHRDLFSLALSNGVGISQGHRAIYDCLLIAEVFNRRKDLQADFAYAQLPFVELIAPKDDTTITKGWQWNYEKQGWFRKDTGEFDDPIHWADGLAPRQKVRIVGGYEVKDLAKAWGFQWDGDKKYWHKLVNLNAAGFDLYPFELAEVHDA